MSEKTVKELENIIKDLNIKRRGAKIAPL